MKSPIEILEGGLNWFGGYIIIPEEYRETFELSDGCEDHKTTKIKSIISVCENPDSPSVITRVKVIDEDDAMWDAEEYMTTDSLKDLVIICGKIDNELIK
jgi:hypothetical protein